MLPGTQFNRKEKQSGRILAIMMGASSVRQQARAATPHAPSSILMTRLTYHSKMMQHHHSQHYPGPMLLGKTSHTLSSMVRALYKPRMFSIPLQEGGRAITVNTATSQC